MSHTEKTEQIVLFNPLFMCIGMIVSIVFIYYNAFMDSATFISFEDTSKPVYIVSDILSLTYNILICGWLYTTIRYIDENSSFAQDINFGLLKVCCILVILSTIVYSYQLTPYLNMLETNEYSEVDSSTPEDISFIPSLIILLVMPLLIFIAALYLDWKLASSLLRAEMNTEPSFWKKFGHFLQVFFLFIFIFSIHKRLKRLSSKETQHEPVTKVFE